MKDPHSVLRQKDLDLERVRKEIQALLIVIPLLADDQPSSNVMQEVLSAFSHTMDPPENEIAQLELYYPFVTQLRMSECATERPLSGDDLRRFPGRYEPGEQKS